MALAPRKYGTKKGALGSSGDVAAGAATGASIAAPFAAIPGAGPVVAGVGAALGGLAGWLFGDDETAPSSAPVVEPKAAPTPMPRLSPASIAGVAPVSAQARPALTADHLRAAEELRNLLLRRRMAALQQRTPGAVPGRAA